MLIRVKGLGLSNDLLIVERGVDAAQALSAAAPVAVAVHCCNPGDTNNAHGVRPTGRRTTLQ
jgi:hypothetical protein